MEHFPSKHLCNFKGSKPSNAGTDIAERDKDIGKSLNEPLVVIHKNSKAWEVLSWWTDGSPNCT